MKTNVNAFVGAKVGGEVASTISWQNPDKGAVTSEKSNHDLTVTQDNTKPTTSDNLWHDFAAIDVGGSAALGAGFGVGFSVGFSHGKFYIRAHAQAVCGAGLSGEVGYIIEAGHVEEFVAFVYHKIKDVNFSYLGFFIVDKTVDAFKQLNLMLTQYLMDEAFELSEKLSDELDGFERCWQRLRSWYLIKMTYIDQNDPQKNLADIEISRQYDKSISTLQRHFEQLSFNQPNQYLKVVFMQVATLTQKGQATIPAKVRKALHLQMGDKLACDINNEAYNDI